MALQRVDGVNGAGEEEVKLMDGNKEKVVITRGDGESDADYEARIDETYAILALRENPPVPDLSDMAEYDESEDIAEIEEKP